MDCKPSRIRKLDTDSLLQFLSWGFTATVIVQVEHNYFGQHIGKTDPYQVEEFNKGLYGVAIVYPLALTFSKLSLLALYWRIFRVTSARRPLQIAAALNVAWMTAAVGRIYNFPYFLLWPLTRAPVPRRHIQLYACSRLLGCDHQKPMHPVSAVLHFERGIHHRFRLIRPAHARLFYLPAPAVTFSQNLYQQHFSSRPRVSQLSIIQLRRY